MFLFLERGSYCVPHGGLELSFSNAEVAAHTTMPGPFHVLDSVSCVLCTEELPQREEED